MKGCRHHHNYCNQQGYIGPLDAISGGHDTCPSLHPCLSSGSRVLQRLCAFLAAGQSAPLHKETNCHDDYRENYGGLNYIRKRHVLHLPGLFRQFDSVGVFLIALVLFRENLFQPLCLLFGNPPIY